jgi:hypothetical protein
MITMQSFYCALQSLQALFSRPENHEQNVRNIRHSLFLGLVKVAEIDVQSCLSLEFIAINYIDLRYQMYKNCLKF